MTFTHPDTLSLVFFLLVITAVLAAIFSGILVVNREHTDDRPPSTSTVIICILAWLALSSVPTATGVIERYPMPMLPLFLLAANGMALFFALSPIGKKLALGLPLGALVAFQAFRLPLEFVLHSWVRQGTVPATMTWTGQNFDIITGVVAILAAPLATRMRKVAWFANGIGIILLINVARVAVMSSPLPFAWDIEPRLLLANHLPYAWIVTVCVAGALAGHVVLTRALLLRN